MMEKIAAGYVKTENFITNLLMIGVVFFVFIAAVLRWAGSPISWSVEFAQFLFVWVIFLGANRCLREDKHISVDFFTKKLPGKVRISVEIVINLIVMAFLIFLVVFGTLLSLENSVRLISNLPISYSFITMAVPIGSLLMIITILFKLKEKIISLRASSN
jgi:TRAP-type transport system small permease protein